MMQEPFIWLALAGVVLLAVISWLRARSKRLRLRIEPVGTARLDSTPEPTEIIGSVRVRERRSGDEVIAKPILKTSRNPAASRIEPTVVSARTVSPAAPETEVSEPVTIVSVDPATYSVADSAAGKSASARLTQVDLFPEAIAEALTPAPEVAATAALEAAGEAAQKAVPESLAACTKVDDTSRAKTAEADDQADTAAATAAEEAASPSIPEDVEKLISLHVTARNSGFAGRQLLELLLQYGLRFGEMSIFHRHEFPTGQGVVLFSVAQAREPGTFDLDTLVRDLVPGVSLFMTLPGYKSLSAYDLMVDTARRLAHDLEGELLSQDLLPVTTEQLETWRNEVIDFERHRLQKL